ncbi:hypothetical protein BKA70DRAFT_1423027 [Coprinopsis sp. MPI-PUGE-AT-0042]|nr:hypothetical protein BKA70DRAFT_1423027 [Coprinopsis sp. MPI-PUGE-AT-0042]
MTLGNPLFTPPILFRGGNVYQTKSHLQEASDIIESLNPTTWLTDNPERAQRIAQLGTQIRMLNGETRAIDERMRNANLDKALDLVLQQAKQPSAAAYLAEVRKNIDKENHGHWDNAMVNYEAGEWWVKACAVIAGTLGPHFLLMFAGYPEQATLRELFTSIFLKWDGAPTSRALSKFLCDWYQRFKGGPGLVPERPIGPGKVNVEGVNAFQEMEAAAGQIADRAAAREAVLLAEREVAFGSRIAARLGGVALEIAGGVVIYFAIDALINYCEKGGYIEMEHDACVSRLTAARVNKVFKALDQLTAEITAISGLQAKAMATEKEEQRAWALNFATEQGEAAGKRLITMLEDATYSKVFDALEAEDRQYDVYTKDDLKKDDLIKKAIETLAGQVKKEAESQKAAKA